MIKIQPKLFKKIAVSLIFVFALIASTTIPGYQAEAASNSLAGFKYSKKVPLPKAQQQYLYKLTKQRGLDYKETLAVMLHESNMKANAKGGTNYGYFQINKVNHKNLAKITKTKNKPYDPYVNMNWGTYMLSDLQKKYKKKGYKGVALKEATLSAYNKGEGGFKKYGKATAYIKKHNQCLAKVKKWF